MKKYDAKTKIHFSPRFFSVVKKDNLEELKNANLTVSFK